MVDADQRPKQHAAGGGHSGADGEHRGKDLRHRDAHGLRHDAVLGRGADPDAVRAEFQEQPQRTDDGGREQRDHQPVPRIIEIEQREIPAEGLLDLARHRAELPERVVLQHQGDAEGGQDGRQGIAAEQRAQSDDMNAGAEQRDDECGDHERKPEVAGGRQHDHAHIGAQHEQLAVGEVHHVHDAEDQRQAGGHQSQNHAGDDAVDRLDQQLIERNGLKQLVDGHVTRPNTGGSPRRSPAAARLGRGGGRRPSP